MAYACHRQKSHRLRHDPHEHMHDAPGRAGADGMPRRTPRGGTKVGGLDVGLVGRRAAGTTEPKKERPTPLTRANAPPRILASSVGPHATSLTAHQLSVTRDAGAAATNHPTMASGTRWGVRHTQCSPFVLLSCTRELLPACRQAELPRIGVACTSPLSAPVAIDLWAIDQCCVILSHRDARLSLGPAALLPATG